MSSDHDDDLPGWISHSESDASSTDAEDDIPDLFTDTTTDTTSRRRNMLLRSEDGLATRHLAARPVAPAWCEIVAAQPATTEMAAAEQAAAEQAAEADQAAAEKAVEENAGVDGCLLYSTDSSETSDSDTDDARCPGCCAPADTARRPIRVCR